MRTKIAPSLALTGLFALVAATSPFDIRAQEQKPQVKIPASNMASTG